jgi:hypothetical protein
MARGIAGVAGGLLAWFIVATILNLAMRLSWPAYAVAENPMTFTLGMLVARLAVGGVSSLAAGLILVWITRRAGMPAVILGVLLIVLFLPVHYGLWDKFPAWYHLVFLVSLLPVVLLGSRVMPARQ